MKKKIVEERNSRRREQGELHDSDVQVGMTRGLTAAPVLLRVSDSKTTTSLAKLLLLIAYSTNE